MKRLLTLLVVVVLPLMLASCSKDHKSLLLGTWEADQASQEVGSDVELSRFNRLEIKEGMITLGNYVNEIRGERTVKKVTGSDETMNYEWQSNGSLSINGSPYEIELKQNEMILRNKQVEIHYNRQK